MAAGIARNRFQHTRHLIEVRLHQLVAASFLICRCIEFFAVAEWVLFSLQCRRYELMRASYRVASDSLSEISDHGWSVSRTLILKSL